jgi:hypothetical protein
VDSGLNGVSRPVVGNDLVAWSAVSNRDHNTDLRFVERILCPAEKRFWVSQGSTLLGLWTFWAAKEAAFKALSRDNPTVFSPCRFEVNLEHGTPEVCFDGARWALAWEHNSEWVHAWVSTDEASLSRVYRNVSKAEGEESLAARELARTLLSSLGMPEAKIEGVPPVALSRSGRALAGTLSLSHDEGYVGVAWLEG